jgi:prophage antirepressor-like protein
MSNIIPFQFESNSIRVVTDDNGEPLFVAKDICEALGYKDPTTAVRNHCKGVPKQHPLQTPGGMQELRVLTEPDVLRLIVKSELPGAERFEAWVFEDVLPTIRRTGSYSVPAKKEIPTAINASKEFRALYGIARLIGCDKNVAAISANQAVQKLTGQNVLALLGHTHIEAENQASLFFTPTELGARIGVSARKFNMLLAEAGMQAKKGEHWVPLVAAEGFCRILDTGKRHGDGTMIQQVKWADNVLALVEKVA